jgi:hypothetical protein
LTTATAVTGMVADETFLPLAAGLVVPVTVGAALSTLTWTAWAASALPALSTLQYWSVWMPSLLMLTMDPG